MPALLLGSISTVVDTSEMQRCAFNEAFARHGLDWQWSQDDYRKLLTDNGGRDRIAAYASERGEDVDADAVHATKSKVFQEQLEGVTQLARSGVIDTIEAARAQGWQVGLVTTTSPQNVAALFAALDGKLERSDFDVVVDVSSVQQPKPAPDAFTFALEQLGTDAHEAVAVEDNVGGASAAAAADVACLAFPNENTVEHDFGATPVTRRLDFAEVSAMVRG